jgi:hypothetical protein
MPSLVTLITILLLDVVLTRSARFCRTQILDITLIATLVGHTVDGRPTVISSNDIANRTGSIVHKVDDRAHDAATQMHSVQTSC